MARENPLQQAFNAGEFSPRMVARTEFEKYDNAGSIVFNLLSLPQGGISRRPGSRFGWEVKDSSAKTRMLKFEFSTEQAYPLEVGNQYIRFGRDQGRIVVADTDASITNGTFDADITGWTDVSTSTASISWNAAGYMNLVGASASIAIAEQSVATTDLSQEHVLKFRTIGIAGDTIKLRIGDSSGGTEVVNDVEFTTGYHSHAFTPTVSPFFIQFRNERLKTVGVDTVSLIDNAQIEVETPYTTAQIFGIRRAQSADVMYLAHPDHPVHKLTRGGNTTWSVIEVDFTDGPWLDQNLDATKTLTLSAATGLGITVTATGHEPFAATDVGRQIRILHAAAWGYAVVTGFTSSTVVTADVKINFTAATASPNWQLGAWSATTGYPSSLTFFEQRLVLASTPGQPQTFWLSQSADLENFQPDTAGSPITVEDDDSMNFTIAAEEVNAIVGLSPGKELVLMTTGGEWIAESSGPFLKPNDIQVRRQTTHGSSGIQPIRVGHVVLFLQKSARKFREFVFSFEIEGYLAADLTVLAEHITRSGVVDFAYQEEPDSIMWCVREDGVLLSLTYRRDQDVVGWSRHVLGGSFGTGDPVVETVITIPGNAVSGSLERNEVWLIVKRTINGATKRYVEFFEGEYEGPVREDYETDLAWKTATIEAQKDAFYVDSGATYDGAPATVLSGLTHLEGETVKIWADGAVRPDKTVSGGQITLETSTSKAQIGLGYKHRFKSLKITAGATAGTTIGKKTRMNELVLVLQDATNLKVGPSTDNLKDVEFRVVSDPMDTAVPSFTGEVIVPFGGEYKSDPRFVLESEEPGPFKLLAVAPRVVTNDMV